MQFCMEDLFFFFTKIIAQLSVSWETAQCGSHWLIGRANVFWVSYFLTYLAELRCTNFSTALAVSVVRTVQWDHTLLKSVNGIVPVFYTLVLRSTYDSFHQMSTKFIVYEFLKTPATFSHAL